jgi:hypothetical protein
MGVVFVVDAAGVGKDLGLEPFPHFRSGDQVNTETGQALEFEK